MKPLKLINLGLIFSLILPSLTFAAGEKQLEELVFACDFSRTVQAEAKVRLCIIGHADDQSVSRDIKISDGLKLTPKIIIGKGKVLVADDTYQGFDYVSFTAPDEETLVTIEIKAEFNNVTKYLYANFYVDSDKAPTNNFSPDPKPTTPKKAFFPDVSETHPQATAINYLHDEDIIQGYPDGFFRPGQGVNRAELLKIIIEGLNLEIDANKYQNCFPDVKEEWFAKYVCYAKEKQWVEGYPNNDKPKDQWLYIPDITVNKVEALKMAINAFELSTELGSETKIPFNDTQKNAWYEQFLATSIYRNLIANTSTTFQPAESMTRGSISEIIYRLTVMKRFSAEVFKPELLTPPTNTSEFF